MKKSYFVKVSLLSALAISSLSYATDKTTAAPTTTAASPAPAAANTANAPAPVAKPVTVTTTVQAAPTTPAPVVAAATTEPKPTPAPAPASPSPAQASTTTAATPSTPPVPITSFNASQVQQIQQVIHDYLVKNPQVLVEASEVLQKQAMAKVEETAKAAAVTNSNKLFADPNTPVGGNPKGTISLVEFFDYQCPHCKDMEPVIQKLIAANKNLRVIYKELPIFGDNSKFATNAVLASQKQGPDKYVKFHQALMVAPNPLTNDKVLEVAKNAGLNIDQLKKDMEAGSAAFKQQVDDNYNLAQTIGIIGTPSFIIATWTPIGAPRNVSFMPGLTTEENMQKAITQAGK